MGKKKQRAKYTSKGQRPSMSPALTKSVARDISIIDVTLTKQKAWRKGQNPWIVIDNPNVIESSDDRAGVNTNKRKIKIRAEQLWCDPKKNVYPPFKEKEKRTASAKAEAV